MDVLEALYTTRVMRRMKPDEIPVDVRMRILDAMIRSPNGANAQKWLFVVLDDSDVKHQLRELYFAARQVQWDEFHAGRMDWPLADATTGRFAASLWWTAARREIS